MLDVTKAPYNVVSGTPCAVAVQQAIDDATAANPQNPQAVYFPAGSYGMEKPLRRRVGVPLIGENVNSVIIHSLVARGPVLVDGHSSIPVPPMVAGLTAAGGQAYAFDGLSKFAYDLRADAHLELDGLSSFCVECFVNVNAISGSRYIVSSSGRRGTGESINTAFYLKHEDGGAIQAGLNVAGTLFSFSGPSLMVGTTYHIALDYDGSMVRFWVGIPGKPSVLIGQHEATGLVTQSPYEDVVFGPPSQDFLLSSILSSAINGAVDCLRFSKVSRYPAIFTCPNTKLVSDGSNLLYLDGSQQYDIFILSRVSDYIPLRPFDQVSRGNVSGLQLRDITFSGPGGHLEIACQHGITENVTYNQHGAYGRLSWCNCFLNSFHNIEARGGARVAIAGSIACGLQSFSGALRIQGSDIQFVNSNGSATIQQGYFAPSSKTKMSVLVKGFGGNESFQMSSLAMDAEGGDLQAMFSNMPTVSIESGEVESSANHPVVVDGGGSLVFKACHFNNTVLPEMIQVINAPSQPIALLNCSKPTSAAWSNNMAAIRIV